MSIKVAAIVAMAQNRCIGINNDLPWHIPEDLKHFKKMTAGKPVIMGSKTFEAVQNQIGSPLPGRLNIILSRRDYQAPEGCPVAHTLDDALALAKENAIEKGLDEIIIGGGVQIYNLAHAATDRLYLTKINKDYNGDAFLPESYLEGWKETERDDRDGDPSYSFITLEKAA